MSGLFPPLMAPQTANVDNMSSRCPVCGYTLQVPDAIKAQTRIADLETQVQLLNTQASTYVNKLADYEEEVQSLRAQCARLQKERTENISIAPLRTPSPKQWSPPRSHPPQLPEPRHSPQASQTVPEKDACAPGQLHRQSLARFTSFTSYLPGRRKDSASDAPPVPPVPPLAPGHSQAIANLAHSKAENMHAHAPAPIGQSVTLVGLQVSLETERQLRQQAESDLTQSQSEIEELTQQLFEQANEMVRVERKERARLEERVKMLETREKNKQQRLERLEKAVERIERLRKMVTHHERDKSEEVYDVVGVPGLSGLRDTRDTKGKVTIAR